MKMGPLQKLLRWSGPSIPFVGETNAGVPNGRLGCLDFSSLWLIEEN
jgi:hypothetical protein